MAIPIINDWQKYFTNPHEGLGSSYERIVLNQLLLRLQNKGIFSSVLETPCFGFTGISGINLVALAQAGCEVFLEDSDPMRINMIEEVWRELGYPVQIRFNTDFSKLDYPDRSLDFGFNFSAMWFVGDLPAFIREFTRVIRHQILICVPNRNGLGFQEQLKGYSPQLYPGLQPGFIDPASIIFQMKKCGWKLVDRNYIDCPPWPDIGMSKEDFIKGKTGLDLRAQAPDAPANLISILDYYKGKDPEFARNMMMLYPFERLAPKWFKSFWAHHQYLLFSP